MSISIWEGIKKYRATKAAEQSGVLSAHQGHKERRLALGQIILGAAEKADRIPLVVGTLFGAGALAGQVDFSTGLGVAMAGSIVVAKGMAALAKRHEFVNAYKNRNFLEEEAALFLNDDKQDYMNKKTKIISTSMEMLIGYSRAYSSAKKYNSYEKFMKFGKGVVTKAMAFVEDEFMASLENDTERSWVDRFLKKPVNKLIPNVVKQYFEDASQKKRLLNWVESRYDQFEDGDYKKILDKEKKGLFASHNHFEKDLEKVFEESYQEILSSSIKTKSVDLINDYFKMCHRFRDQDRLKEQFDKTLRAKFEKVADLYKDTGNEKYYVISKLAESTMRNIDTGVIKHIKGWNNSSDESTNKKIITKFVDQVAVMKDKPRILNIARENNPIITIFNKKLEALIEPKMNKSLTYEESEKRLAEASFTEVEFNKKELKQFKEGEKRHEQRKYLQNHYRRNQAS
jgi:hypothetical protein